MTLNPTLLLTPVRAAAGALSPDPLEVVLRIQSPEAPPVAVARPSLNLAIAIDVSGSMAGKPLEEACRAAIAIVNRLGPEDRVAVVAYDSRVETVVESMPALHAKEVLAERLARMHRGGGTALHAGWLHAAQAAAPHVSSYGLSRVILLSDGQATDGIRDPDRLADEAGRLAAAGVGTSTYGLGHHFNEALMTRLARDGQACYAESAEDLAPYFENEFTMLASTLGRRVSVSLTARTGDGIALGVDNLNNYPFQGTGWCLPNLLMGAETWAAFAIDAPSLAAGTQVVVNATVSWCDTAGAVHQRTLSHEIPIRARASKKEDAWAGERVREARAARLQKEAAEKARLGDLEGVRGILRGMSAMASASNNAYIGGVTESLNNLAASGDMSRFAKEALYASAAMSTRVADTNEDATVMRADRFGLRKSVQGRVHAPDPVEPVPSAPRRTP